MRFSRLIPLIIATALFMENMDSTVIATSLPAIARDIGTEPVALKLALTSYLVSLAVFIPVSGWMADRFGARTVFRTAIGVFMLGSLACAVSGSLGAFVVARFFQGLGGAMMTPVGRLVLLRSVPRSEVVQALATLTIPALMGPLIGPPLGGFITTYFHWRWIFLINIPIGIAGIVLSTIYIPNIREPDIPDLDWRGFLLSGGGLAFLMLGVATGGRHLLPLWASASSAVIGATALLSYLLHARRNRHPLLRLSLLRIRTFRASILGGLFFRIGIGAIPFLLPLLFQLGFGLDPFQSGSLTFAAAVGALFSKTIAKKTLERFGFRRVLTVTALVGSAFLAANGLFTSSTPHWLIITVLVAGGCFRSLLFTSLNALAYADMTNRDMSHATALASAMQQLSLSIGVALGGFALDAAAAFRGASEISAEDFAPAFGFVAAIAALSFFVFVRLPPGAGAEMSGHRLKPRQANRDEQTSP
jgi:EmrB/QacA subfamily drug resistance transporter